MINPWLAGIIDTNQHTILQQQLQLHQLLHSPIAPLLPQKAQSKNDAPSYQTKDFTISQMSQETLDAIVALYGNNIQDIYELGPGQRWMFYKAKTVTSTFFTQMAMHIGGKINMASFRQNLDRVVERHDSLRTSIAYRGLEEPCQVVLKHRQVELLVKDVSDAMNADDSGRFIAKVMLADRRRGFDLERDSLLRIAFYKLDTDTNFVLVSQPHIMTDGVSSSVIMKEIFLDYTLQEAGMKTLDLPLVQFKEFAEKMESFHKDGELTYWKDVLADLQPLLKVPGHRESGLEFELSRSVLTFNQETTLKLNKLQGVYGTTLFHILQTLWALMMMKIYGKNEVSLGAISSGRSDGIADINFITGGMVNAIPVRICADENTTIKELVFGVQKQFIASLQNSHCTPEEIREHLGYPEPLFDVLLNFHNFANALTSDGAEEFPTGITVMGVESFDYLASDLTIYFALLDGALQANFNYNSNAFSAKTIELLKKNFASLTEQLCQNPEGACGQFTAEDISVFRTYEVDSRIEKLWMLEVAQTFPAFQGVSKESLMELVWASMVKNFTEGDVISPPRTTTDTVEFILDGFAEYARTNVSGWLGSVRILKSGDIVAGEGLFENEATLGYVSAASDQVKVLSVPRECMHKLMAENPQVGLNLLKIWNKQLNAMTTLWLLT